jgi:hypothetical protein
VIFAGQFPEGLFDLLTTGFAIHTQDAVIILVFHEKPSFIKVG